MRGRRRPSRREKRLAANPPAAPLPSLPPSARTNKTRTKNSAFPPRPGKARESRPPYDSPCSLPCPPERRLPTPVSGRLRGKRERLASAKPGTAVAAAVNGRRTLGKGGGGASHLSPFSPFPACLHTRPPALEAAAGALPPHAMSRAASSTAAQPMRRRPPWRPSGRYAHPPAP